MNPLIKKAILFSFFLALTACIKNDFSQRNTLVPYVNNVNFPVYDSELINIIGEHKIIHGQGYQGVIVFNIDGTNFRAFDLGCPYREPNKCNIPMQVDEATGEMSCAGCGDDDIRFDQFRTGVTIGETDYYLREYNAYLEGGVVRITNY